MTKVKELIICKFFSFFFIFIFFIFLYIWKLILSLFLLCVFSSSLFKKNYFKLNNNIMWLSLFLYLKKLSWANIWKSKKKGRKENKHLETGFSINRQKIRSYKDKRWIWQHKVRQIRTSNEYSASNSNLHRCIFTGFSRETYRGSFAREQDATSRPNMIEDARQKGKKEKKKKNANARTRTCYALFTRVLHMRFASNIGCITERFRAWHGRKMSGHSLL